MSNTFDIMLTAQLNDKYHKSDLKYHSKITSRYILDRVMAQWNRGYKPCVIISVIVVKIGWEPYYYICLTSLTRAKPKEKMEFPT